MLINQDPLYSPINITLQTRAEADAFFAMVTMQSGERHDAAEHLQTTLANWFSNNYR